MANILNALLGQPDQSVPPQSVTPDISAGLGGYLQNPDQGLNLSPQPLTGDASTRPFTHYEVAKKHGLSELLSIAGDMALASTGLQPQYLPSLHTAKIADALQGFQDDPSGAINRLTSVDPTAAEALYNDTVQNTYRQALTGQSIAQAQKAAQETVQNTDIYKQKVFGAGAAMLNSSNPQTYAAVRDKALKFFAARGASEFAAGMPETYDKDAVQAWANQAVPVDKQVDNERQGAAQEETVLHDRNDEGLRAQSNGIEADNVSSEISNRLNTQATAARNADTAAKNSLSTDQYRKWQMAHPDVGRVIGAQVQAGQGVDIRYDGNGNAFIKDPKTGKPIPYRPH